MGPNSYQKSRQDPEKDRKDNKLKWLLVGDIGCIKSHNMKKTAD